ncbi:MAG: hypothetical protein GTN78_09215, partial [Gemmatimonadales bacterium]|nr:hypothetical protein [Gemmatimonadales bacterium]NIR00363.1 hypothetical protein [Gemmatimonadales bacterium]
CSDCTPEVEAAKDAERVDSSAGTGEDQAMNPPAAGAGRGEYPSILQWQAFLLHLEGLEEEKDAVDIDNCPDVL